MLRIAAPLQVLKCIVLSRSKLIALYKLWQALACFFACVKSKFNLVQLAS